MSSERNIDARPWSVYLVQCADGSLYTGIAKDVPGRVERHNQGAGAKYTRGRGPVELVYSEAVGTRSAALRREYIIKQLPKARKLLLVAAYRDRVSVFCPEKV